MRFHYPTSCCPRCWRGMVRCAPCARLRDCSARHARAVKRLAPDKHGFRAWPRAPAYGTILGPRAQAAETACRLPQTTARAMLPARSAGPPSRNPLNAGAQTRAERGRAGARHKPYTDPSHLSGCLVHFNISISTMNPSMEQAAHSSIH